MRMVSNVHVNTKQKVVQKFKCDFKKGLLALASTERTSRTERVQRIQKEGRKLLKRNVSHHCTVGCRVIIILVKYIDLLFQEFPLMYVPFLPILYKI